MSIGLDRRSCAASSSLKPSSAAKNSRADRSPISAARSCSRSRRAEKRVIRSRCWRYGTYGWTKVCIVENIPDNADKVTLSLGIQNASGTFEVAGVRIFRCVETDDPSEGKPAVNAEAQAIPRGPGKGAKFRGFMSGGDLSPEAVGTLAEWNVNLIRYQMNPGLNVKPKADISTPEKYLAWIDSEIKRLDELMPLFREHGIKVAIDLAHRPRHRDQSGGQQHPRRRDQPRHPRRGVAETRVALPRQPADLRIRPAERAGCGELRQRRRKPVARNLGAAGRSHPGGRSRPRRSSPSRILRTPGRSRTATSFTARISTARTPIPTRGCSVRSAGRIPA